MDYRIEVDSLGEVQVPKDALYGAQTTRAISNFTITRLTTHPKMIQAIGMVKKAAAIANHECGYIDQERLGYIIQACDEVISGVHNDSFITDVIQGGAGTSVNMNANEVIANIALEILGHPKGSYNVIHPNNHVNMSQSTNDAYPTAIKITLYELIFKLQDSLKILRDAFYGKAVEFKDILKMGRTQLQDAVPMTLGQEFKTYATMIDDDINRLSKAQELLKEVNLGATAIGTGINTKPEYQKLVIKHLQDVTKTDYYMARDMIEATQDTSTFVHISGRFKSIAIKVSKICNDLRLLSSGPRAGLNEINLPPMQPGSSIMPGKVNPVMPEVVNQVAFDVIGADVTISMASEHGQLQLNVFEPIIAYKLFISINMMRRAFESLAEKCIKGITANPEVCMNNVLNSATLVTSLNPILGYEKSSAVAKEALRTGKRVYDILLEQKLFTKEELEELLQPKNMVHNYDKI